MSERPSISARQAAWIWMPTLYFASGLPYVAVMSLSTVLYKNMGVPNTKMAAYTGALMLPWVLKPLWSPFVDILSTQRRWIVAMQALVAVGLFGLALAAPLESFFFWTLAGFWVLAIASATHDIAADGFYMASLDERDQSWFVGIRSTFYRLSMIFGSGVLVYASGWLSDNGERSWGAAWRLVFLGVGIFFAAVAVYHVVVLPKPQATRSAAPRTVDRVFEEFGETFVSFFAKPGIVLSLAYLLIYRFSEGQLVKMKAPFLLAKRAQGGLGLTNETLGILDGTIGVALLTLGGILGGITVARDGLRRWLFPMALCINLPNAVYVYLANVQPESPVWIGTAIGVEQFGYGFGFAGYMLYMLQLSRGRHQTAHYALCTGFMALGMMIPMSFSGWIQEALGYRNFFYWVLAATIPSLLITRLAPLQLQEEPASDAA
ncbi:MAG: MFS transporter [Planctomycetes bacterium]|nr:MFS transporter [Planctomycetota bacterium]